MGVSQLYDSFRLFRPGGFDGVHKCYSDDGDYNSRIFGFLTTVEYLKR